VRTIHHSKRPGRLELVPNGSLSGIPVLSATIREI
jgi:hypothetical protein